MTGEAQDEQSFSAEERKRQRLEAWRKKQQAKQQHQPQPLAPKVSLSFKAKPVIKPIKRNKKKRKNNNPFMSLDDDDDNQADDDNDDEEEERLSRKRKLNRDPLEEALEEASPSSTSLPKQKKRRWDTKSDDTNINNSQQQQQYDALDKFMDKLQAGEMGQVQVSDDFSIQVAGTMMVSNAKKISLQQQQQAIVSGGVITAEQLLLSSSTSTTSAALTSTIPTGPARYEPNDWLSDSAASEPETSTSDNEDEEQARRAFIEALVSASLPTTNNTGQDQDENEEEQEETKHHLGPKLELALASEVKSERDRRDEWLHQLETQAKQQQQLARAAADPGLGRFYEPEDSSIMEEAERLLQAAQAAPDALVVLAQLNKKKELGVAVDHSQVEYIDFVKNLYRVPPALARLSHDEIIHRRALLKVRVRGHGAPAPAENFDQCGLSETVLAILQQQEISKPFPIQAQCIPTIMAGRDVIGIAKTGSGKTLAYLLPALRHIMAQPPLAVQESGPICLILAPARELAYQIHMVCKGFAKSLGLKSTAVYGGAGVAEQIADLKRGTHIVVATPGRLIDILTMQSGKILSLSRTTYVVLDEADRMFDMGFEPQLRAILAAIRPDRQTVLFSATFPKTVEALARKSLLLPVEVIVGGRSVASDNVTQFAELVEEGEKFLRLLQLLGEQVEGTKKVIVFVDTQVRADNLFEQLLRNGYPALSLHGGKEQEDRDSTISDFKRKDGPNVLVGTGVAGRGLDVPDCCCVINYSSPNHLEAYVHQVGRTGRAGNKGFAYTFVNSTEESKFAPIIVRALSEAGQSENISEALKELSDEFKAKVEKGEAKYAGSGFKGKGFSYDSTELSETQRVARLEKRQALIEAGMLDPDDEDPLLTSTTEQQSAKNKSDEMPQEGESKPSSLAGLPIEIPENLTPELLALPGMKEALLRKAGIVPASEQKPEETDEAEATERPVKLGDNHWLREFDINDYPREARWKVTQRETTSRLQDEFRTAVTLKGSYFAPGKTPAEGQRRLYLHLEATSERTLQDCVLEIQRLLNEETLRVGAKQSGVGSSSHKYNVL